MNPWVTRIWRALRPSGGRSALTALETASIPVSEEPPFANARASTKITPRVSRPEPGCPWQPLQYCPVPRGARGRPVAASRNRPTTIMRPTDPENR